MAAKQQLADLPSVAVPGNSTAIAASMHGNLAAACSTPDHSGSSQSPALPPSALTPTLRHLGRDASAGALSAGAGSSASGQLDFNSGRRRSIDKQARCCSWWFSRATDNDAVPYSSQTCRDILCHASSAHVGRTIVWLFGIWLVTSVGTTVHQLMTHLGVQSGRGRRRSIDSQRSHQQLRVAQYLSSKVGRLAHLLSGAEATSPCLRSQLTPAVTLCTS